MTGSTSVSVLVPLAGDSSRAAAAREAIEKYLEGTGFTFEVLTPAECQYGEALRQSVSDARGSVIVIADASMPYPVTAIGDAVAMIDSGATDVVFASPHASDRPPWLLRWMLVPELPNADVRLKAFSSAAAKLVVAETKLTGEACDLELAFLISKYGFRVEHLSVGIVPGANFRTGINAATGFLPALKVRMTDRRGGYRAARRCPVCFSSEVWTLGQIPTNVVRTCARCKCRYLNQFSEDDSTGPVRRIVRAQPPLQEAADEGNSDPARAKTSARRLNLLRKHVTAHARVLEIGVRDGSFAAAASREFDYVGIDPAPVVARHARARGLDVYCATLSNFVNTGPPFDAIALFHGFENMADPHDALARVKDLIKPGGILFMTTFDTESLSYLLTERGTLAQIFRSHLILYSRSALIELLEHSGFEITVIGPELEYRDHKFLRHWLSGRSAVLSAIGRALLAIAPDPLLVSSASIRIIARRRAGAAANARAIRSVEATHAR